MSHQNDVYILAVICTEEEVVYIARNGWRHQDHGPFSPSPMP